ncbi:sensor histidine kinase [Mycolicibacterium sp. Dal123E01]|uniref:sensor histidine kinase n=1 Tax=Mycolicibacterium sp. Dal123E01 TaxID=3457578 RepID=UPI00403E84CD
MSLVGGDQLDRVRGSRDSRSLRIVSALRLCVVALMFVAVEVGVSPRWREQCLLLVGYLMVAVAAIIAACRVRVSRQALRVQFGLAIVDIGVVFAYKQLAPPGAYIPLMMMAVVPMMVVLDVSRRRAATVLTITAAVFVVEVLADPMLVRTVGWGRPMLAVLVYVLLCVTAYLAVYVQTSQVEEIVALNVAREALLAQAMTASEREKREVSEFVHDGPLQLLLAARHDIAGYAKRESAEWLDRAADNLKQATRQLREATFELHPAVLEHVGLAAAISQMAAVTAARSGIAITTDADYELSAPADPLIFGAAKELLSNVARHSHATAATVRLRAGDGVCRLEVSDDGVGFTQKTAAARLADGHIGLASHRTRVEAAGGSFTIDHRSGGTRVSVVVPLRD